MTTTPTWVTENVHVRRPERQSLVDVTILMLSKFVILCTSFCSNDIGNFINQVIIKRCCKSNCLWENRRHTSTRYTVQRFIPVVVFRNIQTVNGWCFILNLANIFIDRHLVDNHLSLAAGFFVRKLLCHINTAPKT